MQQHQQIIPIVGARNINQLSDSLGATAIVLTPEHINRLNEVSKIDLGFPHEFLKGDGVRDILFGGKLGELEMHHKGY